MFWYHLSCNIYKEFQKFVFRKIDQGVKKESKQRSPPFLKSVKAEMIAKPWNHVFFFHISRAVCMALFAGCIGLREQSAPPTTPFCDQTPGSAGSKRKTQEMTVGSSRSIPATPPLPPITPKSTTKEKTGTLIIDN